MRPIVFFTALLSSSLGLVSSLEAKQSLVQPPLGFPRVERIPFRPEWVSVVKNKNLFQYKRQEFSSPRILGDRIYCGSNGGVFYAMEKKNGHKVWRYKSSGSVNSVPAFGGDKVFFGDDKGFLYALTSEGGKEVWKTELGSEIVAAPAFVGNRLFVSTIEGKIAAVSAEDGHVLWEKDYPVEGLQLTIGGNAPPVADASGNRIFVGFADGMLRSLSAENGKVLWEKSFLSPGKQSDIMRTGLFNDIDGAPVLDGDRLYFATFDGNVYVVSASQGQTIWNLDIGSGVRILLNGDVLYVSGTDGKLYALKKANGLKLWETKMGEGALTAPVMFGDVLAVGLSSKTMNFIRPEDGHRIIRRFAKKGVFSDPIVDEDRLYYLSNGGRLYSLKFLPKKRSH